MNLSRLLKKTIQQAAGESKPKAYSQGDVKDFGEPRTKLEDFFSSLLDVEPEVDDIRFFDDVILAFEPEQPLLLHLRF